MLSHITNFISTDFVDQQSSIVQLASDSHTIDIKIISKLDSS